MKGTRFIQGSGWLWFAPAAWLAIASGAAAPQGTPASALFTNYDAQSFRKLAAANRQIAPGRVNQALLNAAVFHETNRRRHQNKLPALGYGAKAEQMAQMHSRAMAQQRFVDHVNPRDARKRTLSDRAELVRLNPSFVAENVATAFGRRYQSGDKFYVREENGEKIHSLRPDGPPIPLHSYLTFAEAVVEGWMKSPGHRENILHPSPRYLGCACEPSQEESALETFYCTQVFFTPMRSTEK